MYGLLLTSSNTSNNRQLGSASLGFDYLETLNHSKLIHSLKSLSDTCSIINVKSICIQFQLESNKQKKIQIHIFSFRSHLGLCLWWWWWKAELLFGIQILWWFWGFTTRLFQTIENLIRSKINELKLNSISSLNDVQFSLLLLSTNFYYAVMSFCIRFSDET